jgi:hypothetical protein
VSLPLKCDGRGSTPHHCQRKPKHFYRQTPEVLWGFCEHCHFSFKDQMKKQGFHKFTKAEILLIEIMES